MLRNPDEALVEHGGRGGSGSGCAMRMRISNGNQNPAGLDSGTRVTLRSLQRQAKGIRRDACWLTLTKDKGDKRSGRVPCRINVMDSDQSSSTPNPRRPRL